MLYPVELQAQLWPCPNIILPRRPRPASPRAEHEIPHLGSVYRETISDARLKTVSDHVRGWLFPATKPTGESGATDVRPANGRG